MYLNSITICKFIVIEVCWLIFAVLYPIYSSGEYILSFATAMPWEVKSAAKFAHRIKGQNMYLGLVNIV